MADEPPRRAALRLTDVVKTFPGVVALKGVSLEVLEGEIHAVVGENGAGKSTLIAVAAGSIEPDSGSVEIGGERLTRSSPSAAQALGLAVVYQQPAILDDLTVVENMVFAMPPARRPGAAQADAWCRSALAVVGLAVDPQARIPELGVADRQLVEIAKALAAEARVLILDEPTESLTATECERLFARLAVIRAAGAGIVYISHRLPEVKRIADRITVLRDGAVRGSGSAADMTEQDVLGLIVGRSIDHLFPPKRGAQDGPSEPVLEIRDLVGPGFGPVSVVVASGEIVGLAGVEGNGQRDVLRALAGLISGAAGEVKVGGRPATLGDPWAAARQGVVHVPADRLREGVFPALSVRDNTSLTVLDRATSGGIVRRDRELALVRPQLARLAVKAVSLDSAVETLSGGNQQKVLLARSLLAGPRVLLADEPTRGVDVGARVELYGILRDAARQGQAVVIVSSDALELQGLCDRVLVFSRGEVVRTLEGDAITEADITGAALTATTARSDVGAERGRALRLQRFASGDYAPALILALLAIVLAIAAGAANDRFFSERNLTGMLLLASAVVFVSLGQLVVMLAGGFDLSVGPLTGLTVIVLSFLATAGSAPLLWLPVVIALGLVVGAANGLLVTVVRLTPVIATLTTYIVIQGTSLLLRSQPGGLIDAGLVRTLKTALGPLPVAFIVAVVVTVVAEWLLRRSRAGLTVRAVGSDALRAHRLGAPVRATRIGAYIVCSLFAVMGGLMVASQTGVGDPSVGTSYSLTSITAVVLGGASIFGGRGSFLGAFLGAFLLQEIITATTFLGLGTAWQSWLPGVLILVGAAVYSRARGLRTIALTGAPAPA